MIDNGHIGDLAGPYAVGACSEAEAIAVTEHVRTCSACAAEIDTLSRTAEWIGASAARPPAPGLRPRVLAAALAARPAARPTAADPTAADPTAADPTVIDPTAAGTAVRSPRADAADVRRLCDAYRYQVAELDRLLAGLAPEQWRRPSRPHPTVRALMLHLTENDQLVAEAAGVERAPGSSAPDVRRHWRTQAEALIDAAGRTGPGVMVRLAGRRPVQRPMREALIQRGYETWIHAEDVRAVLDLPSRQPVAGQIGDIAGLALSLLPAAMKVAGHRRGVRLVLTGDGARDQLVGDGQAVAEVTLPAERFCRLAAGRLDPAAAGAAIGGDRAAANGLLTVTATLGCD
jgi:uncharacterized protein (TIGR03083 family)